MVSHELVTLLIRQIQGQIKPTMPADANVSFITSGFKEVFTNHPETKEHWESHPNQRKVTEDERVEIEKLFRLNVPTRILIQSPLNLILASQITFGVRWAIRSKIKILQKP